MRMISLEAYRNPEQEQGNEFVSKQAGSISVALDITVTDDLKERGLVREIVRYINAMRKDASLTINDPVALYYQITDDRLKGIVKHYRAAICDDVIADSCLEGIPDNVDIKQIVEIDGVKASFGIKKK